MSVLCQELIRTEQPWARLLSTPQDMRVVPLWCKRCDWQGLSSEAG